MEIPQFLSCKVCGKQSKFTLCERCYLAERVSELKKKKPKLVSEMKRRSYNNKKKDNEMRSKKSGYGTIPNSLSAGTKKARLGRKCRLRSAAIDNLIKKVEEKE